MPTFLADSRKVESRSKVLNGEEYLKIMEIISRTHRLILAKMEDSDTDLLFELTGDPKVMRFFPKVLSLAETRRMIEKVINHYSIYGHCFWKLLLKDTSDFIGIAGLLHQEIDGNIETEIGYRLIPEYWHRGYATEAAMACKQYGRNTLNRKRLISLIHPGNSASIRVAKKLGAKMVKTTTFLGLDHELYIY